MLTLAHLQQIANDLDRICQGNLTTDERDTYAPNDDHLAAQFGEISNVRYILDGKKELIAVQADMVYGSHVLYIDTLRQAISDAKGNGEAFVIMSCGLAEALFEIFVALYDTL